MTLLSAEFLGRLARLSLRTRKVSPGRFRGERRSRRRGRSVEFADHRDYARGDDLRFLNWNLLARLDRLFLKLYHDEDELRVHVLLDASRSMDFGRPRKFDHARRAAAALAYVALASGNRVRVEVLAESAPPPLPFVRGLKSSARLFDALSAAEPAGRNVLTTGLRRYVLERRPAGLLVLLSDFLDRDGPEALLRPLVRPGLDVHLVQILAPEETDSDLEGDLRLIDSEERDAIDVSLTARTREAYRRRLEAYLAALSSFAARHGMVHALATTAVPFEDLILRHLREEGVLT